MFVAPMILLLVNLLRPVHPYWTQQDWPNLRDYYAYGYRWNLTLSYTPVNYEWQLSRCQMLRLELKQPLDETYWGRTGGALTRPRNSVRIAADGNCLFRAIAYLVTGDQNDHMAIRTAIVNYEMLFMSDVISEHDIRMTARDGFEGAPTDMLAAAKLLETPLYVYHDYWSPYAGWWTIYNPDPSMRWNDNILRLYLTFLGNCHIEVVYSVYPEHGEYTSFRNQ